MLLCDTYDLSWFSLVSSHNDYSPGWFMTEYYNTGLQGYCSKSIAEVILFVMNEHHNRTYFVVGNG